MIVRASPGTLAKLGLDDEEHFNDTMTAYFLQYSPVGCLASCKFCAQSSVNKISKKTLGRLHWPAVDLFTIARHWRDDMFVRICYQSVLKPNFIDDLYTFLRTVRTFSKLPISIAVTPIPKAYLEEFKLLGVDKLGIGLDTATKELFEKWSKPYTWELYWRFIKDAIDVFGCRNVYVHIIVGLGEKFEDLVTTVRRIYAEGGEVALFNYVEPGKRRSIDVKYYRLVQIAVELVRRGEDPAEYIDFERRIFVKNPPINVFEALFTKGCPGCNRPYYTDFPGYPIYNFSSKDLLALFWNNVVSELRDIGVLL